jgi:hypothetical protein
VFWRMLRDEQMRVRMNWGLQSPAGKPFHSVRARNC